MESDDHFCPLCLSPIKHEADFVFKGRNFYRCDECHLLSVCPDALPDAQTEKNRYLNHQNYGCGPAPVLVDLLKRRI
ncbi:MAG: hypothetical protein IPO94_18800 [Saprospiraceae bacterium]|nr:hypothetical protein [Saprospiraceae bacterium]